MVRKLTLLMPLIALFLTGNVYALGLGDVTLKSALNQPLIAEIEVLQEEGLSPGEILPTLAAVADFRRAGVQREFFLSNLNFRLKSVGNGQLILVVSTIESVQEPFLNFLIEVNWPSGRILKEFTILLDPPLYDNAPILELNEFTTAVDTIDAEVAETIAEEAIVEVVTPQPRLDNLAPNQYRVKRNDTMWEIAVRVKPDANLSAYQVMLAIQEVNPNAFIGNNINRVKEGSVLSIPSADDIARWGASESVAEVNRQYREFKNPEATEVAVSASSSTSSALPDGGEQDPEGYLELVSSGQTAEGDAAASDELVSGLEAELSRSLELNDQFERENSELESRLSDLQEQLEILQNLVNLQSVTGAALANQEALAAIEEAPVAESTELSEGTPSDAPVSGTTDPESNLAKLLASSEPEAQEEDIAEKMSEQTAETPIAFEEEPAPVEPAVQSDVVVTAPVIANNEFVQESFVEFLANKSMNVLRQYPLYIIGGLLAFILLLLGIKSATAARASKAKENVNELDEDVLDLDDSEDFELDDESSADFDSDIDAFSAKNSEFEMAEDDHTENSVSDAVGEADIYIAYGRYDQAEALLKTALSEDSSNEEAKLKLAEVYVETGNKQGFNHVESLLAGASASAMQVMAELKTQLSADYAPMESDIANTDSSAAFSSNDMMSSDFDELTSGFEAEPPVLSAIDSDDDRLSIQVSDELSFGELEMDLGEDLVLDSDNAESGYFSEAETDDDSLDPETEAALDSLLDDQMDVDSTDYSEHVSLNLGDLGETSELETSDSLSKLSELDDLDDLDFGAVGDGTRFSTSEAEDSSDDDEFDMGLEFEGLGLDFDTDENKESPLDALDKQIEALSAAGSSDSDELEMDLGTIRFELNDADVNVDDLPDLGGLDLDLSDSEFDVGLDFESESTTDPEVETPVIAELESEVEALAPVEEELETSSGAINFEEVSLDEDFDLGGLEDLGAEMEDMASDDEFDLLGGTDEVSTKLDLARAYIDMEEKDGAREILDEVLKEGDPEQIKKAQDLMAQIS